MNRSCLSICLTILSAVFSISTVMPAYPVAAQSQLSFQTVGNVQELEQALANPDIERIYLKDGLYDLGQLEAEDAPILHITRPVTLQGFDSNVNGTNVEISGSISVESSQVVLDGLSFTKPASSSQTGARLQTALLIQQKLHQITVDHCRFSFGSPLSSAIMQGIEIGAGCHDIEITGCEFGLNLTKGIVIQPQSYDVLIRSNTIRADGNIFVSMAGVSQIRIEDNTVDHSSIEITGGEDSQAVYSQDLTITNNAFLDSYILLESQKDIRQCPVRSDLDLNDNYWGTSNPNKDSLIQMVGFTLLEPGKILSLETFYQSYDEQELSNQGSFSNFDLILEAGEGGSLKAYSESMVLLPFGNFPAGKTVTLVVEPESGYLLESLKGIYNDGQYSGNISFQQNENGQYTFVMPAANVSIFASFEQDLVQDPVFAPNSGTNNNYSSEGPGFSSNGSTTLEDDGKQITFTQAENGVKSAVTQQDGRISEISILVPDKAYEQTDLIDVDLGTNTVSKTAIALDGAITQNAQAPAIHVLMQNIHAKVRLLLPLQEGSARYGTVALEADTLNEYTPVVTSLANSKVISVPLEGSSSFIVKNNALSFSDLSGQEYYVKEGAIDFVSARRLLTYFGGQNFSPAATVTRGMFCQILYNLAGRPVVSGAAPEGVSLHDFYYEASIWASQNKLMGEGSAFNGEAALSREQLVAILWRYVGSPVASASVLNQYDDVEDLNAGYAIEPMAWAVENRIAGQDGHTLTPLAQAERYQMALIIQRFVQNVLVNLPAVQPE